MECVDHHAQITLLLKEIFAFKNVIYSYNIRDVYRNAMKDFMKMEMFVRNAKVNAKHAIPI